MRQKKVAGAQEPLSIQSLCVKAGLDKAARGLAVIGEPKADASGLTTPENEVVEIVLHRISKRHDALVDTEQSIRSDGEALLLSAEQATASTVTQVVGGRIMSTFETLQPVIREVVGSERRVRAEYQAFVHKNGLLERSAQYPDSKVRHFGGVVVLTLFESGGNAAMYFGGSSAGWLGALLMAIAVAVGNVGVAVAGGLAYRYVGLGEGGHG